MLEVSRYGFGWRKDEMRMRKERFGGVGCGEFELLKDEGEDAWTVRLTRQKGVC